MRVLIAEWYHLSADKYDTNKSEHAKWYDAVRCSVMHACVCVCAVMPGTHIAVPTKIPTK